MRIDQDELADRLDAVVQHLQPPDQDRPADFRAKQRGRVDPQLRRTRIQRRPLDAILLRDAIEGSRYRCRRIDSRRRAEGQAGQCFPGHGQDVAGGIRVHDELGAEDRNVPEPLLQPHHSPETIELCGPRHGQLGCRIGEAEQRTAGRQVIEDRGFRREARLSALSLERLAAARADQSHDARSRVCRHASLPGREAISDLLPRELRRLRDLVRGRLRRADRLVSDPDRRTEDRDQRARAQDTEPPSCRAAGAVRLPAVRWWMSGHARVTSLVDALSR